MVESLSKLVLLYPGTFCPLTGQHIAYIEWVKTRLCASKTYIIPLNESVLRKKYNGVNPIGDDDDRKSVIQAGLPDWLTPYYDLMESDDSLGAANKAIAELLKQDYPDTRVDLVTVLAITKLNTAVMIT